MHLRVPSRSADTDNDHCSVLGSRVIIGTHPSCYFSCGNKRRCIGSSNKGPFSHSSFCVTIVLWISLCAPGLPVPTHLTASSHKWTNTSVEEFQNIQWAPGAMYNARSTSAVLKPEWAAQLEAQHMAHCRIWVRLIIFWIVARKPQMVFPPPPLVLYSMGENTAATVLHAQARCGNDSFLMLAIWSEASSIWNSAVQIQAFVEDMPMAVNIVTKLTQNTEPGSLSQLLQANQYSWVLSLWNIWFDHKSAVSALGWWVPTFIPCNNRSGLMYSSTNTGGF